MENEIRESKDGRDDVTARLLPDLPTDIDAFGPHANLAITIADLIETEEGGKAIAIEGSWDAVTWVEYPFRWKPGDVLRRPGIVAPHMPRLDWQMWFAALSGQDSGRVFRSAPWLMSLMQRLLSGSPTVENLFESNPFTGGPSVMEKPPG